MPEQNTYISSKNNPTAKQAVLIISADGFNEQELFYPYYRFNEAGFHVDIASINEGNIKGADGHSLPTTVALENIVVDDYALLYLPGGKAPAKLRESEEVLELVKRFDAAAKPIAAICHGPQILVSAGLVKGRTLAAYPEVQKEIEAAGGTFKNVELVQDGIYITSRWPGDLPTHLSAALHYLHQLNKRTAA